MKQFFLYLFILYCVAQKANAQTENVIQFSGVIVADEGGKIAPVPYANVYMKDRSRGSYSDTKGFFSFVATKGEKVVFSSVGFKTVEITIPDTLTATRYSVVQLLSRDVYNLPATVIYPWPSREHFKIEFLAMNVSDELYKRAMENLAEKEMNRMRRELAPDGRETSRIFLQEKANQSYYAGQFRPMNIMSPLAWQKFFQAWKNGDFKQKADTE